MGLIINLVRAAVTEMFVVLIAVPYPQQGTPGQVRRVPALCDSAVLSALCA